MVRESISADEPARAEVAQHGPVAHVWLRRGVERDAADGGPEGTPCEFWRCEELCFSVAGAPTVEEVEASFDALWAAHEHDGMTDAERIAALASSDSDNADALAELGDMVAEQADALAELGDIVAGMQGGE